MAFRETLFPTSISWGSSGGPGYRADAQEWHNGGGLQRSLNQLPLRVWNVQHRLTTAVRASALLDFYRARGGPADGFRFEDWTDYSTDSKHSVVPTLASLADTRNLHLLGCGDGIGAITFQARKHYRRNGYVRSRPIQKLKLPGDPKAWLRVYALVGLSLIELFEGPGYSVNRSTGQITIPAAIPRGTQVLWSGTFDVAAQFDPTVTEQFLQQQVDYIRNAGDEEGVYAMAPVVVREIANGIEDAEPRFAGRHADVSFGIDYQLSFGPGASQSLTATAGGLTAYLPKRDGVPEGGPIMWLHNAGSNTFRLADFDNNTVVSSFAAGETVRLYTRDEAGWLGV